MKRASLLLLLLLSNTPVLSQESASGDETCSDLSHCPVPYEYLSDQEQDPFLFNGRFLDEQHSYFSSYRWSLFKFPDTRSCLDEEEKGAVYPDLTKINWPLIRNNQDVDVCFFRIISSIGNAAEAVKWFELIGLEASNLKEVSSSYLLTFSDSSEKVFRFEAKWDTSQNGLLFSKGIVADLIASSFSGGYRIVVNMTQSGDVLSIKSGSNFE